MDMIGADLVALYPAHYARVAGLEGRREMPTCPLCGTGDCVHPTTEEPPMSARNQQTENKSANPALAADKAPEAPEVEVTAPTPDKTEDKAEDMFEGSYEVDENGMVRFTREVNLEVPAGTTGARTTVLIAPVGMTVSKAWLDAKRDLYKG